MSRSLPLPTTAAKLAPPLLRYPCIERPGLFARLDTVLQPGYCLLLVSAPAGYGKTTLVASWLENLKQPAAWLRIDENDNDPARLYAGLEAAFGRVRPDLAQALDDVRRFHPNPPPERAAAALVNALSAQSEPVVLILEDAHRFESGPALELFALLIDYCPATFRLVWLTRADPPLPLARLRVHNQLVELHAADLRFTSKESARFLQQIYHLKLDESYLDQLHRRTEGWPAGIQIAALALQAASAPTTGAEANPTVPVPERVSNFTGDDHYLAGYFLQQLLDRLDERKREFLLRTSLCGRLSAGLCAALETVEPGLDARKDAQSTLEHLVEARFFLLPLDQEGEWFAYHSLFMDLLRFRLYNQYPSGAIRTIHRRAASWFGINGWIEEAIHHTLESRDYEDAAALIERVVDEYNRRGEMITLERWLDRLPEPILLERPRLALQKAWALHSLGRVDKIPPLLGLLEQRYKTGSLAGLEHARMRAEIANLRATISLNQGKLDGAAANFAHALGRLSEDEHTLRARSSLGLGEARFLQGDLIDARAAYRDAVAAGQAGGEAGDALIAMMRLAMIAAIEGRLTDAARTYDELERFLQSSGQQDSPNAGLAYLGRGKLAWEWNDLQRAETLLLRALEWGSRGGEPRLRVTSLVQLAFTRQALGRPDEASETMEAARKLARNHGINRMWGLTPTEANAARLALMQGDLDTAVSWARTLPSSVGERPDFTQEPEALVLARVWIAQGKIAPARDLLDRLEITAGSAERYGRVLEAQALMALACLARGEIEPALREIGAALRRAEPQGYVRLFVDEGPPMAQLLYRAAEEGLSPEYAGHLLGAFEPTPPPAKTARPPGTGPLDPTVLIEPLSEREIEIIKLIAAGLSNAEIAARLRITPGTVKVHTSNIYNKLGVHRRTEAVARARQIGIVA